MEKRYKRQLASVSSIHQTSSNGVVKDPTPSTDNVRQPGHNRRASWHGKMKQEDDDSPPSGSAYPLGSGFDSGSEESLASSIADTSFQNGNEPGDSPEPSASEQNRGNLDKVDYIQDKEPCLSDFMSEDDSALPPEMRAIIQERIQQYKTQMMELCMKEAEKKMAIMEQQYMGKMKRHLPTQDQPEPFV